MRAQLSDETAQDVLDDLAGLLDRHRDSSARWRPASRRAAVTPRTGSDLSLPPQRKKTLDFNLRLPDVCGSESSWTVAELCLTASNFN